MEIIWSEFAEVQLDKIFQYYRKKAGSKLAFNLLEGILTQSEVLKKSPFIGQKEPLLRNRKIEYRYLLYKNYKIIYSIDQLKEQIKIADIFDTRQFPTKIKRT